MPQGGWNPLKYDFFSTIENFKFLECLSTYYFPFFEKTLAFNQKKTQLMHAIILKHSVFKVGQLTVCNHWVLTKPHLLSKFSNFQDILRDARSAATTKSS